jgi:hypothetical protein
MDDVYCTSHLGQKHDEYHTQNMWRCFVFGAILAVERQLSPFNALNVGT